MLVRILTGLQTSLAATSAIAAGLRVVTVATMVRAPAVPLQVAATAGMYLLARLDGTVD
jgi:hypothetical protein